MTGIKSEFNYSLLLHYLKSLGSLILELENTTLGTGPKESNGVEYMEPPCATCGLGIGEKTLIPKAALATWLTRGVECFSCFSTRFHAGSSTTDQSI